MSDSKDVVRADSAAAGNVRAWLLCAPALGVIAMFNLRPAGEALIRSPPLPIVEELTGLAISLLTVGGQAIAVATPILLIETPLAFYLAFALHRRGTGAETSRLSSGLLPAIVAGFSWRLVFGGGIGFLHSGASLWATVVLEVWRSLPLTVLLFHYTLRDAGLEHARAARLEVATFTQLFRRVLLPICEPAILLLATLRLVDILRALPSSDGGSPYQERAAWTLLVLIVGALAWRVGRPAGPAAR